MQKQLAETIEQPSIVEQALIENVVADEQFAQHAENLRYVTASMQERFRLGTADDVRDQLLEHLSHAWIGDDRCLFDFVGRKQLAR